MFSQLFIQRYMMMIINFIIIVMFRYFHKDWAANVNDRKSTSGYLWLPLHDEWSMKSMK